MDEKQMWVKKLQEEAEIPDIVWKKAEQTFEKIKEGETGSEELQFNRHMGFGSVDVRVDGEQRINFDAGFLESEDEDWSDGVEYEIMLQDTLEKGLLNKPIKVTFTNLVDAYEGKLNRTTPPMIRETSWELTFNLDNVDSGTVYEVNQQIPGSEAVVKKIRLSPISFTIDLEWTYQIEMLSAIDQNGAEVTFEHVVNPPMITGVVYKDGSVKDSVLHQLSSCFTNEEKTEYRGFGYNMEMIDYENVSELIFLTDTGQVRVPVEK